MKRRVVFAETDTAGIVHFSNFFRYFEDAEHALWRDAGLSIHAPQSEIGWPRVSASCEYHRPLKFEDEFDVTVRVAGMSARAITYAGQITRNGERIATGTWKIACVTKMPDGTMKSVDVPPKVSEMLNPSDVPASNLHPPTSNPASS